MDAPDPQPLTYFWAVALGLIQGLTEFLPVSSSGHLALAEHWGLSGTEDVAFDLTLHMATLLVVAKVYWRDIWNYWQRDRIGLGYVVVASVPAVFCGLLFGDEFEMLRQSPLAVGAGLLVTAGALVLCERTSLEEVLLRRLGVDGALIVGLCQALAITPGISRSGLTLTGGVICGLNREDAVRFSFLMMLPVVAGATLLKAVKNPQAFLSLPFGPTLAGFVTALVAGYAALGLLVWLARQRRLMPLAIYCAALGVSAIIYFGAIR